MTGFRSTYIFFKTGYSNSRLNRHTMYTPEPKISFDAMSIARNLNTNITIREI